MDDPLRITFQNPSSQNPVNPYASINMGDSKSFISPDLGYSADKRKLFTKIGYQPYTQKKFAQEQAQQNQARASVPDSARLIDISAIVSAEKSPDVTLFLRSSNKADCSFYEKRVSQMTSNVNVRNKTCERQRPTTNGNMHGDSMQSCNASRRIRNLMSEKKHKVYDIPHSQPEEDDSPLIVEFNDYQIDSTKANAYNRKVECLSFYHTSTEKNDHYTTFQSAEKQPILARRLLRNQKQQNQDQQPKSDVSSVRIGDSSNKSCSSVLTTSFVKQSINFSALRPVKQSQINNQSVILKQLPTVQGIQPSLLLELYEAKCLDLRINPSKTQMLRFYDMITRSCTKKTRQLSLADFGLGDNAVKVIAKILKNNQHFTSIDLKKNMITSQGLVTLGRSLLQNTSVVHIDIGCNQISQDGAEEFFSLLHKQESITSINMANDDCYKNKNKIGIKGAQALGKLLQVNFLITMIDLTDNALSQEGIHYIVEGVRKNPHVVYLNLSQNDLGTSQHGFNNLLSIFKSGQSTQQYHSLEELNVSSNQLTNKNIEELTEVLNGCTKINLKKLVIGNNKFTQKGLLNMLQCLRTNNQVKLTHLYFDRADLEVGSSQESIQTSKQLMRALTEFLKFSKTLETLSLAQCCISNPLMNALGKGLQQNERLSTLILRGNSIEDDGLQELVVACSENRQLKLKNLDFSSNKINDEGGIMLAQAIKNVPSMEQINLRDNQLGNEASDTFLFLVKEKQNLWKVQLDLNLIKYVTKVEIEKQCKKNKEKVKKGKLPNIKKEIYTLAKNKDPSLRVDALDKQLKDQKRQIQEGFQQVVQEEEIVHDIINQGDSELKELENEIHRLKKVQLRLDDMLIKKDKQIFEKQREWERKLGDEQAMIDKCADYMQKGKDQLKHQKQKVTDRRQTQVKTGEEQKFKDELAKIDKEHEMMQIIMENYEKEIKRIKQKQEGGITECPSPDTKQNALMHILKEEKEMFRVDLVAEGKQGKEGKDLKTKDAKRKGSKKRAKSKKTVVKHVKGL